MTLPPALQGLRLPLIGSPLFIISRPELVIAQCKAGIVGCFPALNAREKDGESLDEWLTRIHEELDRHNQANPDRPAAHFAVNQIVHRSNARLERDVEICARHEVPIWITSLGARPEVYDAAHSGGGVVLHDVINNRFARKAIEKGADGLVAVAAGAGGHAGAQSPLALIQEIRAWFEGALYLSGAIARGAEDIVYSNLFTGVHGNYLKPSIAAAGLDPDNLEQSDPTKMNFAEDRQKPKRWKEIWGAGQGIGAVDKVVPTAELVDRLEREFLAAKARLEAQTAAYG